MMHIPYLSSYTFLRRGELSQIPTSARKLVAGMPSLRKETFLRGV